MLKYLTPFMMSFLSTVILNFFAILAAKKLRWKPRKSKRHIHDPKVYRIGGAVMVLVFAASVFLDKNLYITSEIYGFIIASLVILVFGFWDDIKELYWKIQLFFQIVVAILTFIMGIRIYFVTNPLTGGILKLDSGLGVVLSVCLVIFWIILVINAVNWIDGIDGLSGGITIISMVTILLLSLKNEVNQPPLAILASIIIGTVLGFLIFNFYPARIMAGTAGAMFMGFSLAVLAILAGTKIATALLVLAIPIIDFLWVIGQRIKDKRSIFRPDKNHLHYKLLKLGWTQKQIALSFYAITMLISIVALNTRAVGKGVALALSFFIMSLVYVLINKKISIQEKAK